jgi:dihydroorotate dehydrogenase
MEDSCSEGVHHMDEHRQIRLSLAAGMVKTHAEVKKVLHLPIGEVTLGSITRSTKEGNPEPVFYTDDTGNYWNSIGLKNGGVEYYRTHLSAISREVRSAGCTLVVSISGTSTDENATLTQLILDEAGNDTIIELNVACPNVVVGENTRKPLIGYSIAHLRSHVSVVGEIVRARGAKLRIKMPPYTDYELLEEIVASVIIRMVTDKRLNLDAIVATNTLPGCLPLTDEGNQAIRAGLAGGSGAQLHALALGNVQKWRTSLPDTISVIGVGGIRQGYHVHNFERVGATRCQMAGAYWHEGPSGFIHAMLGL